MKNINETETLNNAIILLQAKRDSELVLLKEQFHEAYESLRPINIIKSAFKEVASPNVQGSIVDNAIGLGTGFISKKILFIIYYLQFFKQIPLYINRWIRHSSIFKSTA